MKHLILFAGALLALLSTPACTADDQDEIDRRAIENYLSSNNINATAHPSGIYYVIDTPGSGGSPTLDNEVEVKYKGYLLSGDVFDQTTGTSTAKFPLRNLITGWQVAIPLLQKGGKGTFFIPSSLGYGDNPPSGIPANAVLIFDIELVNFK